MTEAADVDAYLANVSRGGAIDPRPKQVHATFNTCCEDRAVRNAR